MATEDATRRVHRIPGKVEILRHHVAGSERDDAQRQGGSGEPLDYIEDGTVAATDKNGIVALRDGDSRLCSSGSVFACFQDVDRSTRLAKNLEHPGDISAPCTRSLEYWIN
jgi:hypothetical protein